MYKSFFKRLIDFFVAMMGLLIISPIFLLVAIMLWFDFKGTPFFKQQRPGMNEKIFSIIKFKTMNNNTDANGKLLPDSLRITKLGRFIRKTSLDEIPQLFNVLKGDMSLVGPRPLLPSYLPYYKEDERIRHSVRPGITGLAQVSGRNYLTWEEKFAFDAEYVNNLTFRMDFQILSKTVKKALSGQDVAFDADEIVERLDDYRKNNVGQKSVLKKV
ncbi:sugar transferase [Flagellimonas sediminis]|uniref:Sugar transferase n=1 Tax=Flagellimonas sediminis TaxID=2696468 RepID=A0A6I5KW70_9FLAO|nr:sugar transferase [Allomuricauda sediminis]NDV42632.1 sugar transferase [Allomuricauda sediminis]